MLFVDLGNTMTEFAGVAGSMQIFGVSKYISVPLTVAAVWILVVKGTYKLAERIFLIFSFALLSYIVSALLGKPDWEEVGKAIIHPGAELNYNYISMVIAIIGTTIAPWMQFYMQSSVIEKGLKVENYKYTYIDVIIGCVATVGVAFFIMVACASTLYVDGQGTTITAAEDAAAALEPLAGALASHVFAFGLFIASVFAATILPITAAFYICEAFGFEAGIDKKLKEAPQFYTLYTAILIIGAGIILIPGAPLISITLWSQRINGIMLPIVLISMIKIINKEEVMGKYVNKPINNIISWFTIIILIVLSLAFL
jgi:Mn2+/Fe2+ NRAMP family transporter